MENEKRLIYLEDALAVMPALEMCTRALRNLPTVDVVEVVHARWELECRNRYRCSCCGLSRNTDTQTGWEYCPRCGAKMDGDMQ